MKLEYFWNALDHDRVLLLYEGTTTEVDRLRVALRSLTEVGSSIVLHELTFIEAVNGCQVVARSDSAGVGLRSIPNQSALEWVLSPAEWLYAVDLLEPFSMAASGDETGRFQYLHEHGGPEVVYSTIRAW